MLPAVANGAEGPPPVRAVRATRRARALNAQRLTLILWVTELVDPAALTVSRTV